MARTYKRDANGRFAGGGGSKASSGSKSKSKTSAPKARKGRSLESRLRKSAYTMTVAERRQIGMSGPRTRERVAQIGRRKAQQQQAIANLIAKQSPSGKKKGATLAKRLQLF